MRRFPPFTEPLPRRVAASALAWAILAGAAPAQDPDPDGIGAGLLDIAREALPAGRPATPDAAAQKNARAPELVAVPHPSGGAEIVPLGDSSGSAATPATQDAGTAVVAEPLPQDRDPAGLSATEMADVGTESAGAADPAATASPADSADGTARAGAETTTPAPSEGSLEGPEKDAVAAKSADPVDLLKGLWREAVASGDTSEGFETWLSAALNPKPEDPSLPESQAGRSREVAVAWSRRTGPVALGKAGRVVTTFGESIPVAHCSPLKVCYIELEPGETLTDTPSVGDSLRWQVALKVQGRNPETPVLEIKPAADAVETNLVIPTDRRLYTITLVNDPEFHTPIVAFRWPDSEVRAAAERIERQMAEELAAEAALAEEAAVRADVTAAEMAHSGVPTESGPRAAELLDFRFKVTGDAAFRPVRVFADGSRTYIDLHPRYRGPLPVIVAGKAEGNAALNTRVSASGSRLVADRVITDVWLQSGRERVRIRRTAN